MDDSRCYFRPVSYTHLDVYKRQLLIGPGVKNGLNIRIENPSQLGSNLVVDAVAALDRYQAPMVIFDMGTSTTASVIDREGRYIGGFISPGVRISLEAGASGTAQLPRVGLEAPETVIGRNTVHCLQSGAVYGTAGMIDGMITRIAEELGEPEEALTVIEMCIRDRSMSLLRFWY